jgi:hypothetical protein
MSKPNRWNKRVLLREDVLMAVKAVSDFLMEIVHGEQPLPYQPKATVFNLYASLMEKSKNDKKTALFIGHLFFVSKDETDFNNLVVEVQNFLKTRGKPVVSFTSGRNVTL